MTARFSFLFQPLAFCWRLFFPHEPDDVRPRIKCAVLAWHTLEQAPDGEGILSDKA